MSLILEALKIMSGYAIATAGSIFFMNFISRGLILKAFWVWGGQRKGKVLVGVRSVTGRYFKIGKLNGSVLTYRTQAKKEKTIPGVERKHIDRLMGVPYLEHDEVTDVLLTPDMQGIAGISAELVDAFLKRILMLPRLNDKRLLYIFILCGTILAVSIYCAYKLGKIEQAIAALNQVAQTAQNVAPPGNVI